MNLSIQFRTDKLPVAFRLVMVSIIKQCVRTGDEKIYHDYFESQRPKPYTFSVFMQNFAFVGSEIALSGFRLNVSSSSYEFLIPLLNGLQRTTHFQYKGYSIRRGMIQYGREQQVHSNRITVTTNSPILIEDENRQPLAPGSPDYNRHLNRIANQISASLRGHELKEELRIDPVSVKKVVIKESNGTYAQAASEGRTTSEYLFFTAYRGKFCLAGHPQDLQWLLDTGIGLRTSQGFGHIRLESEVMMQQ